MKWGLLSPTVSTVTPYPMDKLTESARSAEIARYVLALESRIESLEIRNEMLSDAIIEDQIEAAGSIIPEPVEHVIPVLFNGVPETETETPDEHSGSDYAVSLSRSHVINKKTQQRWAVQDLPEDIRQELVAEGRL